LQGEKEAAAKIAVESPATTSTIAAALSRVAVARELPHVHAVPLR